MLRLQTRFTAGCGVWVVLAAASTAHAQLFGSGCDCAPAAAYSASAVSAATTCQTVMQPVAQSCYQSVAVTEYHPVVQTVRRPKVEARVVNQDVIEYVPVTEQRVAEVPVTTYQDVTEYQQVARNGGYYQTHIQQNVRPSPCEYDNRRTAMGWMNRTAYEFRSMFVPKQTVRREFIPQTVVQTVPVTRRVAVQCNKQVSYNVTRMVAQRSTRQVAVNHITYEDVQTTAMMPKTVMRQVPIGTQMSYVPLGASQLSLQPTPDSAAAASRAMQNRSAAGNQKDAFDTANDPNNYNKNESPIQQKKISYPRTSSDKPSLQLDGPLTKSPGKGQKVVIRSSPPSMVRLNRWVARTPTAPEDSSSDISVADVDR